MNSSFILESVRAAKLFARANPIPGLAVNLQNTAEQNIADTLVGKNGGVFIIK